MEKRDSRKRNIDYFLKGIKLSGSANLRKKFWEIPLNELNNHEWEMLCDGCGKCCLKKIVDVDSKELFWTRIVCKYFDQIKGSCKCYSDRVKRVSDCVDVKEMIDQMPGWIPETCAYRLRAQNKPLFDWHPLLDKTNKLIHKSDISIIGKCVSEDHVHPDGYHEHVVRWVGA